MATTPKPIRIAIVLNGQEFICQAVILPFSLEGYPPLEIVWYGAAPEAPPGLPVRLLPDLHPGEFDLVLDGQFLTAGLADFSPARMDNLVTGPVARFLNGLVCQLQEMGHKQEINAGVIDSAADALITINEDHVMVGYNRGEFKSPAFQRGAMHTLLRCVVAGDTAGIDEAWRAIDATF